MNDIYVHYNPGGIKYNTYVLLFVRSWFMPTLDSEPAAEDTWLKVPALKSVGSSGALSVVCCNANIEHVSLMSIEHDTGTVLRVARAKPTNKQVDPRMLDWIIGESLDVSDWEYQNQKSWPYDLMFKRELIKHRYTVKYGQPNSQILDAPIESFSFNRVKRAVLPKPCNCPGQYYSG